MSEMRTDPPDDEPVGETAPTGAGPGAASPPAPGGEVPGGAAPGGGPVGIGGTALATAIGVLAGAIVLACSIPLPEATTSWPSVGIAPHHIRSDLALKTPLLLAPALLAALCAILALALHRPRLTILAALPGAVVLVWMFLYLARHHAGGPGDGTWHIASGTVLALTSSAAITASAALASRSRPSR